MNIESCLNAAIEASTKAGNKLKENFLLPHELLVDVGRDIKLSIDKEIEDEIKQHLEGFGFNFLIFEKKSIADSRLDVLTFFMSSAIH